MRRLPAALLATVIAFACTPAAAQDSGGSHRFVEVRSAKLFTQISGHGPPILFLHGGLQFFDPSFLHQRSYFAADHTIIGIDQRGHGHSPDNRAPLSYQEMADDTAAVIRELGVGPVDVVGHSDGGDVALLLARDHPELVRRMVISGANLRPGLPPDELQRRKALSSQQTAEKIRALGKFLPPRFRTNYEAVSPDGAEHWMTLLEKSYWMWLQPVVIEPADLKKIAVPILVMAGDHDFTSIEETTEIYRGLPHGQLFILPDTGHGTLEDRPELANLAIREFLERPADANPH